MICGLCTPPPLTIRSAGPVTDGVHRDRDGRRGQHRGGRDQIAQRQPGGFQTRDELRAVLFAARALRRLAAVVRIAQQFVEQRRD